MKSIVLAKFSPVGQVYAFGSDEGSELSYGDAVIAETGQGPGFARVVAVRNVEENALPDDIVPVLRRATEADFATNEDNRSFVELAKVFCVQRIRERGLDMKLVNVECLFDRSKLIFYFTAPTRVDFRELVKELVREYHTRIELRQIGVRHETQMVGALGCCGMVCCCRQFLHKFVPVTIKMAKEQNLFLNPTKISGICGRLLCCLSFEQENYDIFHRSCPKLGKRYQTSSGLMKVLRANLFRNSIAVLNEQGEERELSLEEWKALDPRRPEVASHANLPSQAAKPQAPGTDLMVVVAEPEMLEEGLLDEALDDAYDALSRAGLFEDNAPREEPAPAPESENNSERRRKRRRKK